jgi:hypothetical protein
VKQPLVQRTFDRLAVDVAVGKMRVGVRADIARGIETSADIENRDAGCACLAALDVAVFDRVRVGQPDPALRLFRFQSASFDRRGCNDPRGGYRPR